MLQCAGRSRDERRTVGAVTAVALASRFWGLGCPKIFHEVATLLARRSRSKAEATGKGAVIALLESKGGSGATTIAVNLAHTLAREHKANTLLIDLDIQFGAVAMSLDLQPSSHILDALLDHERIDAVFLNAIVSRHTSGLSVLAAPKEIAPICNIREDAVIKLIDTARDMYEFVILDIPSVFTPWSIAAMRKADPLLLVVQNRLETIIHAKMMIEHLPYFQRLFPKSGG
ncbi:MAG: hypothetical protein C3L25_14095 [Candidatus Sedimenticola endophacoides]|nr:MAG: hypothetical protein C3L26_14230 [Candidatus Sedimenticola endophacoides]PUE00184.1 MAG: hypothetical protein C3L25_14095 [Candidatus Sedimenticola endophacoides]